MFPLAAGTTVRLAVDDGGASVRVCLRAGLALAESDRYLMTATMRNRTSERAWALRVAASLDRPETCGVKLRPWSA